jgi:hypothetical protein
MDGTDAVSVQPHGRYVVARLRGELSTQTVAATRRALVGLLRQSGVAADVNGQVVVPAGGQVKVRTPRFDQLVVAAPGCRVRASRMR